MKRKQAAERSRRASEARSMLWALQQLTTKNTTSDRATRSYLYELHQIATPGMAVIERIIADLEANSVRRNSVKSL